MRMTVTMIMRRQATIPEIWSPSSTSPFIMSRGSSPLHPLSISPSGLTLRGRWGLCSASPTSSSSTTTIVLMQYGLSTEEERSLY
jgi:hypothetical protein